jgi:GLPGLI family protein
MVTAWYTPEIPVNQGPDKYWDCRFDLEVNDGKKVILCSKVVLNPKTKSEIKATPTKGKEISQKRI